MRIAINGLTLMRTMTGIGRTTLHTLRAMLAQNTEDEFLLFLPSDAPDDLGLDAPNLEIVQTDVSLTQAVKSVIFEEFQLPLKLRGAKIDLYYAPSFLLPAPPTCAAESSVGSSKWSCSTPSAGWPAPPRRSSVKPRPRAATKARARPPSSRSGWRS